ncbi:MAG: hypothetical protein QOF89_2244 [Acidobacteriota bacterium]|jgi:hypothetical protein|nr:hypothetical protein [Acidobacteriota bacterium]
MVKVAALSGGALAALLLTTAAAWAVPTPQGTPFRVTSCDKCRQDAPVVAGSTTGAFLAVWEGSNATEPRSVDGRFFNTTGAPQANDFAIVQSGVPDKYDAAVTRDTKGNFIVVWSSVANDNSDVMAQKFQVNGNPLGAPFKVNVDDPAAPTIPMDFNPAVARTSDGGFIVAWIDVLPVGDNFPGTQPQVMARRFTAAATPAGPQIKVSTGLVNGDRPEVCVDTAGRPVIVWTTVNNFRPFEANLKGIAMRRLSAKGVPLGGETPVVAPAATTLKTAVSCGNGSTFVVVWQSDAAPATDLADVLGQRFNNQGRPAGAKFVVNSTPTGEQRNPAISHDSTGAFVVVWQALQGGRQGIYGRRFTVKGAPTGPDFEVASDTPTILAPINPDVAHTSAKGNFVVVWQKGSPGAIFGLRFTP